MTAARILACVAALVAAPAFASVSPSSPTPVDKTAPQSVWRIKQDGTAVHLQSQWRCPAAYDAFVRTDLHLFDDYGLDVDCNYLRPNNGGDITLYLTKSTGGDIKAAFEGAKQAMLRRTADATPLPDGEQKTFPSNRPWLHMTYAIYGGKARDGVWYAWYGDWLYEIRATYPAADEDKIMQLLARMTGDAEEAGRHLERCAKSQIPVRDGVALTEKDKLTGSILIYGAMLGSDSVPTKDAEGHVTGEKSFLKPAEWCAEGPVEGIELPVLMWHAVGPDGGTQPFDRVSVMTMGPAPVLESDLNPIGALLSDMKQAKPEFFVSTTEGDDVYLYGIFADRPGGKSLAAILGDYYHGKGKPLAKVNPKTNNITVFTGPERKD